MKTKEMFEEYFKFRKDLGSLVNLSKPHINSFCQQINQLVLDTKDTLEENRPFWNGDIWEERKLQIEILELELKYVVESNDHNTANLIAVAYAIKKTARTALFSKYNDFVVTLKTIYHNFDLKYITFRNHDDLDLKNSLKYFKDLSLKQSVIIKNYEIFSKSQAEQLEATIQLSENLMYTLSDLKVVTELFREDYPEEYGKVLAKHVPSARIKNLFTVEEDLKIEPTKATEVIEVIAKQGFISKLTDEPQLNSKQNDKSPEQSAGFNEIKIS